MQYKKYITSTMKSANGRLQYDKASLTNFVKNEMPANVPFWLSLVPKQSKRTTEFNSYYWSCVLGEISKETGASKEALHETFKLMFNPENREFFDFKNGVMTEEIQGGSTKFMSTKRFAEFVESVKMFAVEKLNIAFELFDEWLAMNPDEVRMWEKRYSGE